MAPARAQKLAGKLNWYASMVFRRCALGCLAPPFQHAEGRQHKMSRQRRSALEWWTKFLRAVTVRTVPAELKPMLVVTVYSHATARGRGGSEAYILSLQGFGCASSLGLPTKNTGCNLGACGIGLRSLAHFL